MVLTISFIFQLELAKVLLFVEQVVCPILFDTFDSSHVRLVFVFLTAVTFLRAHSTLHFLLDKLASIYRVVILNLLIEFGS